MLEMIDSGGALGESYEAPISLWRFGTELDLVGLSGEVPAEYAFRAREVFGSGGTWITGYSHEVFGYLPTAKIVEEGGYETRGLVPPEVGYFAPDVEEVVVDGMSDLRKQMDESN